MNSSIERSRNIPELRFPKFEGEWEKKKLGDLTENISSGKSKDKASSGLYPFYGSTGKIGYSNDFDYSGKKILIARVGANAGSLYKVEGDYSVTDNTLMLDLLKDIDVDFIYSYLVKNDLNKLVFGSGQPLITGGQLKSFDIYIPKLSEQTKIASFVTAVDEKIQALKKKHSLLEQYKKGAMQKLFSQELRFKDEDGNEFPEWEEFKLGDVAEITIGEFVIKTKQNPNAKYPVYNGGKSYTGFYDEFNNEGNKIIISARGANAGFVNFAIGRYWAGNSCYSIGISDKTKYDILYFYHYVKMYENRFLQNQQAANIPSVSKKDAENFIIQIPSISEQNKISIYLSAIDEKINQTKRQIEKTEIWKKGLLQKMFV